MASLARAVTDETGDFFFAAIVPGAYTVRVEAPGFRPIEQKGNMVLSSARLALGKLQLEVGSVTESVHGNRAERDRWPPPPPPRPRPSTASRWI